MVLDTHPTFACPHCGAVYPFRPVLVDRAVRCTKCTKPFKVRADKTVEKVEDIAPVPTPEISRTDKLQRAQQAGKTARVSKLTTPPPPSAVKPPVSAASEALTPKAKTDTVTAANQATKPAAALAKPTTESTRPEPAAAAPKAPTDSKKPAGKSLNEQQEEMRRRMAASLHSVADKLAKDDDVAEPTEVIAPDSPAKPEKKDSAPSTSGTGRHPAATSPAKSPASSGTGTSKRIKAARPGSPERKNANIVLTNEGERLEREERGVRLWILGALAVPVLLVLLWWCWPSSDKSNALRAFATPPEGESRGAMHGYPDQVAKRGWMVMPQLALINAGDFSFAAGSSFPVTGCAEVLAPLHNLAYDAEHAIWTAPNKTREITSAWSHGSDRDTSLKFVAASIGTVIDQATVEQNLAAKGLDPSAAKIIARMATGVSGADGHAWLDDLINHPPSRLALAPFSGSGSCIEPGLSVKPKAVTYQGTLMRIEGPPWPQRWLMWEITAK